MKSTFFLKVVHYYRTNMICLGLKDQHETFMHLCSWFFFLISLNEASSLCERLKTSWKSFLSSVSLTLKTGHLWTISPGMESTGFTALQEQPQWLLEALLLLFAEIYDFFLLFGNHLLIGIETVLYSETFSFVLTGEDGSRRFGYCRRLLVSCSFFHFAENINSK